VRSGELRFEAEPCDELDPGRANSVRVRVGVRWYSGTSLIRKRHPLGPYSRPTAAQTRQHGVRVNLYGFKDFCFGCRGRALRVRVGVGVKLLVCAGWCSAGLGFDFLAVGV